MVITQLQPISLVFAIPQDDIHRVQTQLNKTGQLKVVAYNRDFTTTLAEGSLTAIDNQVDAATGTLRLKATFANEDNVLFPNEFVNVRLKVETLENAITVPSIAVQRGPQERFVYVVKKGEKESTVEVRPVVVGTAEGLITVIKSGLEVDEIVVTEGLDKLQPGAKVILRSPNEHLPDLYHPSRRYRVVHGGYRHFWHYGLSQSADIGLATSRLPDDTSLYVLSRCWTGGDDFVGDSAVGTTVWQIPGLTQMTSTSSDGCSVITLRFALN